MHGGLLDMWNRIQELVQIEDQLDVIATVKEPPAPEALTRAVAETVHSLDLLVRKPLKHGACFPFNQCMLPFGAGLRHMNLGSEYDSVIMQTEFTAEILRNPSLKTKRAGNQGGKR